MLLALSGCGGSSSNVSARTYALGFTDFPHANSLSAWIAAYSVIQQDGDMAAMHFDDGVPWTEALNASAYHASYLAELSGKRGAIPPGHLVYLAVTPLSFTRDGLASYRGPTGGQPLSPPWDGYALDHPDVVMAFKNHCSTMISIFSPDYFAYGIEVNMLADAAPAMWGSFVNLAQSVYTDIKADNPNLPVFLTLQADWFNSAITTQTAAISQVLPYTDYIAISSYPYASASGLWDPASIPIDYFSGPGDLDTTKPFAVAETAWPAETVTTPYPVDIPANETWQATYVERVLNDAALLDAVFVNWFFTRDFDDFWNSDLQYDPNAPTIRLWKDTGLYDGNGNPRAGLSRWRRSLGRRRR